MLNKMWHPTVELCGFGLEDGTIIACENKASDPTRAFQIDEQEIKRHDNIVFFWHSHPSDDVNLSLADYHTFLSYPEHRHRIYGSTKYAEYYVRRGFVMREEYDFEIS